jgi:hypothetical protein
MATALAGCTMPTKPLIKPSAKPFFEDLPFTVVVDLTSVKGGCKSKSCCNNTTVVQAPPPPPPAAPPPPPPSAPEIKTNVTIAGY